MADAEESLFPVGRCARKMPQEVRMVMPIAQSLLYFLLAGLCEIGGGYLVWLWLRESRSVWFGVLGGLILFLYGIIPTLQPASFGRVYAAYGGVFVVLSLLWGWQVDKTVPDRYDVIGAGIALLGVLVIMYWPRG
jgi:small multidrug resistance family-3 protein